MILSQRSLLSGTYSWFPFINMFLLTLQLFSLTPSDFACFMELSRCARMLAYKLSFWLAFLTALSRVVLLKFLVSCSSHCPTALGVTRSGVLACACVFLFSSIAYISVDCLKCSGGNSTCIQCSNCLSSLLIGWSPGLHLSALALLFFLPLW